MNRIVNGRGDHHWWGLTLCAFALLFAVAAIVFGHSRNVLLTAAANFGAGGALIGALMTATTIAQHSAEDRMRGRVMGLFPLVMGVGMLAALPVGVAAQATSLELVVPTLGWATLGLGFAIVATAGALRGAHSGRGFPAEAALASAAEGGVMAPSQATLTTHE